MTEQPLVSATVTQDTLLPTQSHRLLARMATVSVPPTEGVVIAMPDPTFDGAAGVILGQDLDLRGKAGQSWLTLSNPGDGEINYAAFGTTFFTVKRDQQARDDWHTQASTFEGIAQEVYRGKFDLMDVGRLRDAATAVDNRVTLLDEAIREIDGWTTAVAGGDASGSAATALAARLAEFVKDFTVLRDQLTSPAPTIASTLHAATDALDTFARGLAGGWFDSHTLLLSSPDDAVNAIVANIQHYLQQQGLLSSSPAYQQHGSDPATGAAWVRGILAAYSSDAGGGLLPGMDPISGDLTTRGLWDAANASITKRVTGELDKLDGVAKTQVQALAPKFQAVTDRLKEMPMLAMRVRGRMLPARKAIVRTADEGQPALT